MNSEWYAQWLDAWLELWKALGRNIRGYVWATVYWDEQERAHYAAAIAASCRVIAYEIVALIEHGAGEVTFIWEEWANDFIADFEAWLLGLLGIEVEPDAPANEHIANLWESVIALWARFGYAITNTDLTVVDWVQDKLSLVWDSIVAIWARFGPAFLEGEWTVVSWVEDKVTAVVQWVLSMYETARLQAQAATDWIAIHGQVLVDWLTDYGEALPLWIATYGQVVIDWVTDYSQNLVDWYNTYATYYADLYDNYHETLTEFLEDPGTFIGKYIDPYIVIDPGEEDPNWLLALLAFLLNPIGWLLVQFAKWHGLIAAWIIAWLDENFEPYEVWLAKQPRLIPDLPTWQEWIEGIRNPTTGDEIAYVETMAEKFQHVRDGIITDKPWIPLG